MHFTLISIAILVSCSTTHSYPAERNETSALRARPIQQFFKNILSALRSPTTPEPPTTSTTKRISTASSYMSTPEFHEIPNFVDFSTYLLDSFASNNTAIKFTYMQPTEKVQRSLPRNFSLITFVVPHDTNEDKTKGIFSFLSSLRLPWTRKPDDTDISQFPPVLEYFVQRIQAYFSIYKYSDDSRINNTIVLFVPNGLTDMFVDDLPKIEIDEGIETTTDYQLETTTLQDAYETTTDNANEME